MQSYIVRSTILILALTAAVISESFADNEVVTATKKHEVSAGAGGGHQHYVQSDEGQKPGPHGQLAPRLHNLGEHTFSVSTRNPLAQQYINQGLNLAYAFNHAEARRAFREAARLDPGLAMAYWGQAEQRAANDKAYAEAMRKVHQRFPDDADIAMLYVESMMDLRPWGYWMLDGQPYEGTAEIVALTEEMLRHNPKHPGALHMYIHLIESTSTPERAEKAADTLLTLLPAAGHLIHMSSHIYQRVGRYADSMKSNQLAIAADEDYITQCHAQGLYPMVYYPHNIHFLWFAATMDGQSKIAIQSAREVASKIDDEVLNV